MTSPTHVSPGTAHGAAAADPLRIPPIAADLLPLEIRDARSTRRRRRQVVVALLGTVALVAAAYAGLLTLSTAAGLQQRAAEREVAQVRQDQQQYAELIQAQQQTATIEKQLTGLMADDVRWQQLLRGVTAAAPSGTALETVNASLTGFAGGGAAAPGGAAPPAGSAAVKVPGGDGERVIGTVSLTGTAKRRDDIARYLTALEQVPGVDRPMLDSMTSEAGITFALHADLTAAALGGRFRADTGGN